MPVQNQNFGASGGNPGGASVFQSGNVRRRATADLVGRMPPYNEEAEQAVLAGMIHYPSLADDISTKLKEMDFHVPRHQLIYQACLELFQSRAPLDLQSIAERLRGQQQLEAAGGLEYLNEIYQLDVLGSRADYYAEIVLNKSMQRQLISACATAMTQCYDAPFDRVKEVIDEAEHSIFSIAEGSVSGHDLQSIGTLKEEFFTNLQKLKDGGAVTGVTTGFPDLDQRTSGLQPSDLIIIAARPSMGKTAFALNLALNAARRGNKKVAFFSLEMSAQQLEARLISISAKVNLSKLRRPRFLTDADWTDLYHASEVMDCDLYIDDTPALRTLDLRAKARRMKARMGLDIIFVDYLQLMRPSRPMNSRELEISEISRSLKALAKELNIPVIALSQLNRKLEERTDKRPILSDLRESGAIEQDADVIMFIYREDVYHRKENGERAVDSPAEIIIGKQRNGPVGTVNLLYKCEYTSFESVTPTTWGPDAEAQKKENEQQAGQNPWPAV